MATKIISFSWLGISLLLLCLQKAFAQTEMPGEPHMPNFCANPTKTSISGNWSDPNSWDPPGVPAAGDGVLIASQTSVTYDLISDAVLSTVCVNHGGHLAFRTDIPTRLTVLTLAVARNGILEIGTEQNPVAPGVAAEVVFADQPINTGSDPSQYGHGLVALGTIRIHGFPKAPTFLRLAAEPRATHTELTLEGNEAPLGWQIGDKLVLPTTEPAYFEELLSPCDKTVETPIIAAINANRIALSAPLACDHLGARDADGTMRFLPHIGNLSRNAILRSQNPNGTRGHVFFGHRANVDVRYALFKDLGRTNAGPLDNTTYDPQGNPTHIGTNQIGRYAIHLHHLWGPQNPVSKYQFSLLGNAIDGARKWSMAVHDSHYGLVQSNVLYNIQEGGLALEDGNESHNVVMENFIVRVGGPLSELRNAIWMANPGVGNQLLNNVGASCFGPNNLSGSVTGTSFHLDDLRARPPVVRAPLFPGADMSDDNQVQLLDPRYTTLLIHGLEGYGMDYVYWNDHHPGPGTKAGGHYVANVKAWGVNVGAANAYGGAVTFDGVTVRKFNFGFFQNSTDGRMVLLNADIQNPVPAIGILHMAGAGPDLDLFVENSTVRVSSPVVFPMAAATGTYLEPSFHKTLVLNNVRLEVPPGMPARSIIMSNEGAFEAHVITPALENSVIVYNYNQQPGDNFRVYFTSSHPDALLVYEGDLQPPPGWPVYACPSPGMTNQQCQAQHGRAFAGAITPCLATRPEIVGYVCPLP